MATTDRRGFLKRCAAVTLAAVGRRALGAADSAALQPEFRTSDPSWQAAYDAALRVLAGNVRTLPQFPGPVLTEGAQYNGIWMECGPHESLVYRKFRPDVARHSHRIFFAQQRPDGQFPAAIRATGAGFGQIQMVVPIAATARELAEATRDEGLLRAAYDACARWDAWLMRHRDRRGTGLIEGFCTYDTGNDNSPRWAGIPNRCPDGDARKCPPLPSLPRLCPDLSATTYGARVALATMARDLGLSSECDQWTERAAALRSRILSQLYSSADAAFFDRDAQDRFVRIRSEIITRVCGEHLPGPALFDDLWRRQIGNAQAFWPAYPLPSIAVDDPHFVRPIPHNSWGGASQALTALRASRWLDHYGRSAEFSTLMDAWCAAIQRDGTFRQQIDPWTGVFTPGDNPAYSPCALVMVDFTWRLAGIVEQPDALQWNVRPGHPAARAASFHLPLDRGGAAELIYDETGARMRLAGAAVARIEGGAARVVTDGAGHLQSLVGIAHSEEHVSVRLPGGESGSVRVRPNEVVPARELFRAQGG